MRNLILPVLAIIAGGLNIVAQNTQEKLGFEVATIKPADPAATGNSAVRDGPKRVLLRNMTLRDAIYYAYGGGLSTAFRVTGGPDWINRTRFDIQGQAQDVSTAQQFRMMVQSLLADRFALKIHQETQSIDVFALTLARSDGKLGPKVTEWDGTCQGDKKPSEEDDPLIPRCWSGYRSPGVFLDGSTMFSVGEVLSLPMSRNVLGRIVQDQTGLKGRYKLELNFQFPVARPADPTAPADTGPSLFTAIREQWGLKLEPAKGPLQVVVVDSAQPPTAN